MYHWGFVHHHRDSPYDACCQAGQEEVAHPMDRKLCPHCGKEVIPPKEDVLQAYLTLYREADGVQIEETDGASSEVQIEFRDKRTP